MKTLLIQPLVGYAGPGAQATLPKKWLSFFLFTSNDSATNAYRVNLSNRMSSRLRRESNNAKTYTCRSPIL